jgi:hypothetical protein
MELRRLHIFAVLVDSSIYSLRDAKFVPVIFIFYVCTGRQNLREVIFIKSESYCIKMELNTRVIRIKTGKVTKSDTLQKQIQHNNTNLQCSPLPRSTQHLNVPPRHKSLGRGRLLVDVPASNARPALPPRTIWNDVYVESSRGQKRWKSLGVKSGVYGGWGNTSNCKPW